eukprot:858951-Prorocentrum_minimum.AAC.4
MCLPLVRHLLVEYCSSDPHPDAAFGKKGLGSRRPMDDVSSAATLARIAISFRNELRLVKNFTCPLAASASAISTSIGEVGPRSILIWFCSSVTSSTSASMYASSGTMSTSSTPSSFNNKGLPLPPPAPSLTRGEAATAFRALRDRVLVTSCNRSALQQGAWLFRKPPENTGGVAYVYSEVRENAGGKCVTCFEKKQTTRTVKARHIHT